MCCFGQYVSQGIKMNELVKMIVSMTKQIMSGYPSWNIIGRYVYLGLILANGEII